MARTDEERRWRIDMHLHSRGSSDCLTDPAALIACLDERGLDRICLTDHNTIDSALALRERFPERVMVGEEVKTREGVDVIGLFVSTVIPKGTPALETCTRIHDQGGVVYVPHPFAPGKGGGGRILAVIGTEVDAVEGFNARLHRPVLNERAVEWGRARNLPLGAGSDAHTLAEVGRAWVELPTFADEPAAFLAALRQGTIHGRASSRAVHLASTYAKLHQRFFKRVEPAGVDW